MRVQTLIEATQEYTKKVIDPALMTFQEYHDFLNPKNKWHSDRAYDWSLEQMQGFRYNRYREFPILLNRIRIQDQSFEVRLQRKDMWDGTYHFTKTTPDGDIVRGPDGMALYLSVEEIKADPRIRRFRHMIGVFNEQKQNVAIAQEEWGAWLFVVAQEYRGLGLGKLVGKLAWTLEPDRGRGGFRNSGFNNLRGIHKRFVQEYVRSGMYRFLVKRGQITPQRAQEIIASTRPETR